MNWRSWYANRNGSCVIIRRLAKTFETAVQRSATHATFIEAEITRNTGETSSGDGLFYANY